jgi:hypothetical protein
MIGAGGREGSVVGIRVLGFLLLCPAAFPAAAEERAEAAMGPPRVPAGRPRRLPPEILAAIQHAHAALEDPRCREIFQEFRDASGGTLQSRLDSLGQTGQAYLEAILFYDGSGREPCRLSTTLAATIPGHRVVFYCRQALDRWARHDRPRLMVTILHEELHSLGLGENPPTSREISLKVAERCR